MRRDAVTCSQVCRQARHRFNRAIGAGTATRPAPADTGRRLAYADPPYPGLSRKYYADHPDYAGEVDYTALVEQLAGYDGWALSTSAAALPTVLEVCPDGVRVAAWHRGAYPHGAPAGPLSAWEPVISSPPARRRRLALADEASRPAAAEPSHQPGTEPARGSGAEPSRAAAVEPSRDAGTEPSHVDAGDPSRQDLDQPSLPARTVDRFAGLRVEAAADRPRPGDRCQAGGVHPVGVRSPRRPPGRHPGRPVPRLRRDRPGLAHLHRRCELILFASPQAVLRASDRRHQ